MFTNSRSRQNASQDHVERGVWGELAYVAGAGASLTVRGTGTVDTEVPLMNLGYGFNLPSNSNAEMVMLSLGRDNNDKVAIATIPRDMQHQWAAGQGGVQHPTNPDRRVEFNADETWLKDGNYKLGDNKEVEIIVSNGAVTINVGPDAELVVPNLKVTGNLEVVGDVKASGGVFEHNGTNVGANHTHSGVDVGGGSTGGPN